MKKKLTSISFLKYYEEEEKEDGIYWQYLNITPEEEIELNLNFMHNDIGNKIIPNIKNPQLKEKMQEKLKELIKESKILSFEDVNIVNNLFNSKEVIELVESKVNNLKDNYSISFLIDIILNSKDAKIEWQINQITNILDKTDDTNIIIKSIKQLKDNTRIYYQVIKNLNNKLPIQFFKYFNIKETPNYIQEKKEKVKTDIIRIGIDPKILVGLEIEANGQYQFNDFLNNQERVPFKETMEATVPDGIELSTKKELHDTKEDVAMLKAICDTMTDLGYYYDEKKGNAAGQINLGLDYLDTAQSILIFYEIFLNCEELLWYISNEEGQIARQNIFINSRMKPISEIIGKRILDEDITREEVIELFNDQIRKSAKIDGIQYKKNTVCLRGTNDDDWRLEIRIPNGGCNFKTWVDNIRLYGKMMEISKKIDNIMKKKDDLTKEEERLLGLKIDLQNKELDLKGKLSKLMDLLFDDEEIKDIYYNRFYATKERILETGTTNYIRLQTHEPAFDEVEIQGQYGLNNNDIYPGEIAASYDPETGEYYNKTPRRWR